MPVNGLIRAYDQLRLGLRFDFTASGYGSISLSGELDSLTTPDASTVSTDIQLLLSATTAGGWSATYNGPNAPFGGYTVTGAGVPSPLSIDCYLNNFKLYGVNPGGTGYNWRVFCSGIDIYVNGGLSVSLAGFDMSSSALGPSWIPIFCGYVHVGGSGSVDVGSISGTTSGGWQFKIGSNWYSLPVAVPNFIDAPLTGPSVNPPHPIETAPFGLALPSVVVSTATWGNHISWEYSSSNSGLTVFSQGGTVDLIPNLPRSIQRLNSDFGADWYIWGQPKVQASSARRFSRRSVTGPPGSNWSANSSATVQTYARGAPIRVEVGPVAGLAEAFMTQPTYSPCSCTISKVVTTTVVFPNDTDAQEALSTTYLGSIDSPGACGSAPYMTHSDPRMLYFNSAWVHPHWSIGYYTNASTWGGPADWDSYFGPIREQWLSTTGRRNSLVSCALADSGWTPFLASFDANLAWVGVCRWQTQNVTPPATLTPDSTSSPAWSVESGSCTLAFGATVTVTPSASVCKFNLDLQRFDVTPFFYASIAKSVFLDWPSTNITNVKVYAKSSDGTTVSLFKLNPSDTTTTPHNSYPFPQDLDSKYAGSWAIDNGNGAIVDIGSDYTAGGMSGSIMGDTGEIESFGMLLGRGARYLHFEVTVVSTGSTCQINYPVFTAGTEKLLLWENGQVANVLYKNGPGVRLGNHIYYASILTVPPLISGLGYKGSVIDWLCDKRVLLQGVTPTGGTPNLTTECTNLYDSFEGNSVGQVDKDSYYFLLPPNPTNSTESAWKAALVNTWSETPPLAGFPTFDRDPNTWNYGTGFVSKTWAWCQIPRRFVSCGARADLYLPDGVTRLSSTSSIGIIGWNVTEASPVVTNYETANYWIITTDSGIKKWANVTPWHGYYSLLTTTAASSGVKGIGMVETDDGESYLVYLVSGDIWLKFSQEVGPAWQYSTQITSNGSWSNVSVCALTNGRVEVRGCRTVAGVPSTYRFTSTDHGKTFTTAALILMASTQAKLRSDRSGPILEMVFVPDSGTSGPGTFSAKYADNPDKAFSAPYVPTIAGGGNLRSDGSGFDFDKGREGSNRWFLAMIKDGDTTVSTWWSGDQGATWHLA